MPATVFNYGERETCRHQGERAIKEPQVTAWRQCVAALADETDRAVLVALRVTGSHALAEEVVQEAYSRLLQHPIEDCDQEHALRYLLKSVHSIAIDHAISYRAQKRREQEFFVAQPRTTPPPEHTVSLREMAEAARNMLNQLGREERVAVSLCCEQGLSRRTASEILGVPERTVSNRVERGLLRLRERLTTLGFAAVAPVALAKSLEGLTIPPATAALTHAIRQLTTQTPLTSAVNTSVNHFVKAKARTSSANSSSTAIAAFLTVAVVGGLVWSTRTPASKPIVSAVPVTPLAPTAPAAVLAPPSALPAVLLRYDFEDGRRLESLKDGEIVPTPGNTENKFCAMGVDKPDKFALKREVHFEREDGQPLFMLNGDIQLSVDCYVTNVQEVTLYIMDSSDKDWRSYVAPCSPGVWTNIKVNLDAFSKARNGNRQGAGLMAIIAATYSRQPSSVHLDNLQFTRIK